VKNIAKKEYYPLEAEVESGCTLTKSGEIRARSGRRRRGGGMRRL
jgi:hypothetical protein